MEKIHPLVRLHFIVFLWGFTGIVGKLISIDALPLVWLRMFFTIILIYIYLRLKKKSVSPDKRLLKTWIITGVLITIHWYSFFHSIKLSNVAIGLSMLSTGTIFTAFLEPLFYKRRIKINEVMVSFIVVGCIFFIFQSEGQHYLGILYGLLAAFLSAIFTLINGRIAHKASGTVTIFYELLFGWIFLCFIMSSTNGFSIISNTSTQDFFWILILGGLLTAFPMIESMNLMRKITPFTLILSINLEPIYGIIIAFFIFGEQEQMSVTFYVATAVILLALIFNGIYEKKIMKKENQSLKNA
ncbi:MAG: DMT family transporter [Flavobacteriales bacterium]